MTFLQEVEEGDNWLAVLWRCTCNTWVGARPHSSLIPAWSNAWGMEETEHSMEVVFVCLSQPFLALFFHWPQNHTEPSTLPVEWCDEWWRDYRHTWWCSRNTNIPWNISCNHTDIRICKYQDEHTMTEDYSWKVD